MQYHFLLILTLVGLSGCGPAVSAAEEPPDWTEITEGVMTENVRLQILGTVQDAGSPQIGCNRACCLPLRQHPDPDRRVSSLGLFDGATNRKYLFDATPNLPAQASALRLMGPTTTSELPDGIFLTHAHIGHYTGLMYLGKEAINAPAVPVYAMPRMEKFLIQNGPWSQLVTNGNIELRPLRHEEKKVLSERMSVTPILVPHRDEYSETVGYLIEGPSKKALFIPDIDKWGKWDRNIIDEIAKVDYAFLDGTFYSGAELGNRDIRQIPHPFIIESLEMFKDLDATEKAKIIFLHFNHSNPLLDPTSGASQEVLKAGFKIGRIHQEFEL